MNRVLFLLPLMTLLGCGGAGSKPSSSPRPPIVEPYDNSHMTLRSNTAPNRAHVKGWENEGNFPPSKVIIDPIVLPEETPGYAIASWFAPIGNFFRSLGMTSLAVLKLIEIMALVLSRD